MSKVIKTKTLTKSTKETGKNEAKVKKETSDSKAKPSISSQTKATTSKTNDAPKVSRNTAQDAKIKIQASKKPTKTDVKTDQTKASRPTDVKTDRAKVSKPTDVKTDRTKVSKPTEVKSDRKPVAKVTSSRSLDKPIVKRESKISSTSMRAAPLKASHKIPLTKPNAVALSPNNVMNKVHNVTVSSPPPKRHEIVEEECEPDELQRGRTRTRTLEKEEIVLLKPEDNPEIVKVRSKVSQSTVPQIMQPARSIDVEIKQPVSFEISFDEKDKIKTTKSAERTISKEIVASGDVAPAEESKPKDVAQSEEIANDEEEDYDDDFEAYESDFESEPASHSETSEKSSVTSDQSESSSNEYHALSENEEKTVIFHQAVKLSVDEEELDSGSFELKVMSAKRIWAQNEPLPAEEPPPLDEKHKSPEMQNDSGIEYNLTASVQHTSSAQISFAATMNSLEANNKTCDNISDIEVEVTSLENIDDKRKQPFISQRGRDLLNKIVLDTMNYVLFDFKPIPYERFMRIYGKTNTTQTSAQTHNNSVDQESQVDTVSMSTKWTQSPATFYTKHIPTRDYLDYRNGCGNVDEIMDQTHTRTLDNCTNVFNKYLHQNGDDRIASKTKSTKPNVDYDMLNNFLQKNALTISRILNDRKRIRNLQKTSLPLSSGYFSIDCYSHKEFENTEVYNIFASRTLPNFLFTLHRNTGEQLYLVGVWDLSDIAMPVCVLSTWSSIVCIEVHSNAKDVVIAGLEDGSLALWNIKEAQYWHPKLNEKTKRLTPSQLVTSTLPDAEPQSQDIGKVVSIRSIYSNVDAELLDGYNTKQICSLHECGILTLWTILITSTNTAVDITNKRIDHQSLWSKMKLTQSNLIDLRSIVVGKMIKVRPTSAFEKNRLYFEKELFSDAVLQELQETNTTDETHINKLICSALEVTEDGFFVATNKNFLIFGRKSFKANTIRKILVNAANNSPISFLMSLEGYEDDVLLVGLQNGLIKSLCIETEIKRLETLSDSDEPSISSASSLPPMAMSLPAPVDGPSDMVGKSCVIQNIVQGERKLYDESQAVNNLDMNEYKPPAANTSTSNLQRLVKLTNFLNDQPIIVCSLDHFQMKTGPKMSHLVKSNKFITLQQNKLKIYDIESNREININDNHSSRCYGIASTSGNNNIEYLVLLKTNNVIDCHLINSTA